MISLEEPPKPATLAFDPLEVPARKAFVVAYDAPAKLICEAVVNLALHGTGRSSRGPRSRAASPPTCPTPS